MYAHSLVYLLKILYICNKNMFSSLFFQYLFNTSHKYVLHNCNKKNGLSLYHRHCGLLSLDYRTSKCLLIFFSEMPTTLALYRNEPTQKASYCLTTGSCYAKIYCFTNSRYQVFTIN